VNAVLRTSQISERIRLGQGAEHPAFARRCCPHIQGEERYENGLDRGCFGSRFGHRLRQRRGRMRPGLPQHFQRRLRRRRLGQRARTERMSCSGPSPTSVWWRVCLAATYASVLPGLTRRTFQHGAIGGLSIQFSFARRSLFSRPCSAPQSRSRFAAIRSNRNSSAWLGRRGRSHSVIEVLGFRARSRLRHVVLHRAGHRMPSRRRSRYARRSANHAPHRVRRLRENGPPPTKPQIFFFPHCLSG
jgi:hypothetical protein